MRKGSVFGRGFRNALGDGLNRFLLLGPVDNLGVDRCTFKALPVLCLECQPFQIIQRKESRNAVRRIEFSIPKPNLLPVGKENERLDTSPCLNAISVVGGLAFSLQRFMISVTGRPPFKGSQIHVERNGYTVPSRLIGEYVEVRMYVEHLEVWYARQLTGYVDDARSGPLKDYAAADAKSLVTSANALHDEFTVIVQRLIDAMKR